MPKKILSITPINLQHIAKLVVRESTDNAVFARGGFTVDAMYQALLEAQLIQSGFDANLIQTLVEEKFAEGDFCIVGYQQLFEAPLPIYRSSNTTIGKAAIELLNVAIATWPEVLINEPLPSEEAIGWLTDFLIKAKNLLHEKAPS